MSPACLVSRLSCFVRGVEYILLFRIILGEFLGNGHRGAPTRQRLWGRVHSLPQQACG